MKTAIGHFRQKKQVQGEQIIMLAKQLELLELNKDKMTVDR
eukprot:UN05032